MGAGQMSRNIIGMEDEDNYGWLNVEESESASCIDEVLENFYKGFKDPAPDVFTYSAPGISGSFFLKRDGEICHTKKVPYTIEIPSGLTTGTFFIWNSDGTKYEFNSDYSETTETIVDRGTGEPVGNLTGSGITAWKLVQITSPIGDTIKFEYEPYEYSTPYLPTSYTYTRTRDNNQTNLIMNKSFTTYDIQLLSKITSKYQEASFNYETDNNLVIMKKKLNSIIVKDRLTNDTVIIATLNHGYFQGDSRLKLNSVEIKGNTSEDGFMYSFDYYSANLVSYGHYRQDLFGFLNNNTVTHMIDVNAENSTGFNLSIANREVDTTLIRGGALQSITFPTGGKAEYTYEANLEAKSGSTQWQAGNYYSPGQRVRKICHFDNDGQKIKEVHYEYSNLQGNLHYYDHFLFCYSPDTRSTPDPLHSTELWSSSPIQSLQTDNQFLAGAFYGQVDILESGLEGNLKTTDYYEGFQDNFQSTPVLKKRSVFHNNDLIKETLYEYVDTIIDEIYARSLTDSYVFRNYYYDCQSNWYLNAPPTPVYEYMTHYIELSPMQYTSRVCLLKQETHFEAFEPNNDSIKSRIIYDYNDKTLLQKITHSQFADNAFTDKTIKQIKYPEDYTIIITEPWLNDLLTNKINGAIIDTRNFTIKDSSIYLNDGKIYRYNSLGQPLEEYFYNISNPNYPSWDSTQVISTDFYLQNSFSYDTISNNLVNVNTLGNDISVYWGYNHRYPVAKIQGIKYSDVIENYQSVFSEIEKLSTYYNLHSETCRDSLKITNQQIRSILPPTVMITTYTYSPDGLTSQTDASGNTTFYTYDLFGRMSSIRNRKWQILKMINYNLYND
jgi:YD repeat-containing protein